MGALPNVLPGYQSVEDDAVRGEVRDSLGLHAARRQGTEVHRGLAHSRGSKRVRAAYIVGHNPAADRPPHASAWSRRCRPWTSSWSTKSSSRETAKLAHVVLPAAAFAEKDGTFVNADRQVQRVRKVVEPPPGCKTDVEILCELAERMGYAMSGPHARGRSWTKSPRLVPIMAGISYARLERESLVWPCLGPSDRGARRLYEKASPAAAPPSRPSNASEPMEQPDADYPLVLTTGRRLRTLLLRLDDAAHARA